MERDGGCPGEEDRYGRRFVLDFEMAGVKGRAIVRSLCMVRTGEDFPRLMSCFVLRDARMKGPKQFDVVALLEDLPAQGLIRGQVGTIVEVLGPDVFEVEFSGDDGRSYASLALESKQFLVLHHEVVAAD